MTKKKDNDIQGVDEIREARSSIVREIEKVIIGQRSIIDQLLISLFSRGHCLLIGVPGLAKTLLISTLASVLDLKYSRIQFTPDLMPSDITGTEVLEEDRTSGKKVFRFIKGPVFANIILADEINRTPPKTQAALLQAMQEYEISIAGQTFGLDLPFFVLATQNPIEQEGTYPLPEAQLDRFMFNLWIDYPSKEDEMEIVHSTTSGSHPAPKTIMDAKQIMRLQDLVRRVPVSDIVVNWAVDFVRQTRPEAPNAPKFVRDWISWGGGPRASQYLILGAKSRCVLDGRLTPDIEDVKAVAVPVLRHRIVTNFNADADNVTAVDIIEKLLADG